LFKDDENGVLLDTFEVTGVNSTIHSEIGRLQEDIKREKRKAAKEKKKAEKAKAKKENSTKDDGDEKVEEKAEDKPIELEIEEPEVVIPTPKLRISVELSRSGYMTITKAFVGQLSVDHKQVRKPS
jgi:hypothetical protein